MQNLTMNKMKMIFRLSMVKTLIVTRTGNCKIGILLHHLKDKPSKMNKINHKMNKLNNKEILLISSELKNLVIVLITFNNMSIWKSMNLIISKRNHFFNLRNQLKIYSKSTTFKDSGANIKRVVSFH